MQHAKKAHKRSTPFQRISSLLFQGNDPWSYLKAASKLLVAGFLGVAAGWIAQPFFSLVLGIPYYFAYWPAVAVGFIVNLRTQVRMKNLKVTKDEQGSIGV